MKHTCYVIDDEAPAIEALVDFISKTNDLELIGSSQNPLEALEKFRNGLRPDITFLDIDMPEISGLDVADLLRDQTTVIFTTAHPNYAVAGYDKDITDFLLKPISHPRFLKAVKKVTEKTLSPEEKSDVFYVNPGIKGKLIPIRHSEIIYIEGQKNYVRIHTATVQPQPHLTLQEIQDALPANQFARVHKSYMINISKIKSIDGNRVTLVNDFVITLGPAYREKFLNHLEAKALRTNRKSEG